MRKGEVLGGVYDTPREPPKAGRPERVVVSFDE